MSAVYWPTDKAWEALGEVHPYGCHCPDCRAFAIQEDQEALDHLIDPRH